MIYPKEVQEFIVANSPWGGRLKGSVFPNELNKTTKPVPDSPWLDFWLCTSGYKRSQAV